jgi:hypothetical protein
MANLPVVIEDIAAALHWPIADLSLTYRWAIAGLYFLKPILLILQPILLF